jgi:hypothetical protein
MYQTVEMAMVLSETTVQTVTLKPTMILGMITAQETHMGMTGITGFEGHIDRWHQENRNEIRIFAKLDDTDGCFQRF